ncbi:MAG: AMP-binding protein [Gammaproteobacteria bacterium]|nr:AMP-binding protein [Gammaproteobacteria bacterium]
MEKIWLQNYPPKIPYNIDELPSFNSIPEMFEHTCEEFSSLPAFYSMGVTLSFQQLEIESRALAAWFQTKLHLKKGDRIAIMLPNILQYPVAMFAALRAGLIVVNVNPLYTASELVHQVNDSGAKTIIVLSNFLRTVQQALPQTPIKHVIVTNIGDLFPKPKAFAIHFYLKYIARKIPFITIPGAHDFRDAILKGKTKTLTPVKITSEDIAFLQYTGGTTGVAKGAMLSHKNIVSNVLQAETWFSQLLTRGKEIMITALPLYHIFSLLANCFFISKIGGLNVLIANPRDIKRMVSDMSKIKFTVMTGVNTLFNALVKFPDFAKLDFSSLKMCLGGGMAVQRAIAEQWRQVTGVTLIEAYGLTEASPCVASNPADLKAYNGTVGLPLPSTDVCVLDDEGHEVPIGEVGELAIKGPQVMMGYWKNPLETAKVFTPEGWLLTGDIVSIDEKGYISIRERKKDMIIVSGFNVYPNEIEDVLARLAGVREVAVVGVPDRNSGEAVKAFIVKDRPDLTAEEVTSYCYNYLTGYKIPKQIEFCDELPKSNVGKILRRALRDSTVKVAS